MEGESSPELGREREKPNGLGRDYETGEEGGGRERERERVCVGVPVCESSFPAFIAESDLGGRAREAAAVDVGLFQGAQEQPPTLHSPVARAEAQEGIYLSAAPLLSFSLFLQFVFLLLVFLLNVSIYSRSPHPAHRVSCVFLSPSLGLLTPLFLVPEADASFHPLQITADEQKELDKLEVDLDYDDIILYRSLADALLKGEKKKQQEEIKDMSVWQR